jgi:hypothetical protein
LIPITPFNGVRSSWFMLAMNCDFIFEASTASAWAADSRVCARLSSVMSRPTEATPTTTPSGSKMSERVTATTTVRPSLVVRLVSSDLTASFASSRCQRPCS